MADPAYRSHEAVEAVLNAARRVVELDRDGSDYEEWTIAFEELKGALAAAGLGDQGRAGEITIRCSRCMGTGELESDDSTDDSWWDCSSCGGTGKVTIKDRRRAGLGDQGRAQEGGSLQREAEANLAQAGVNYAAAARDEARAEIERAEDERNRAVEKFWEATNRAERLEARLAEAEEAVRANARLFEQAEKERDEAEARRSREIVAWLRGRTGAYGGGFTSADDVADAIERKFVKQEPGGDRSA